MMKKHSVEDGTFRMSRIAVLSKCLCFLYLLFGLSASMMLVPTQ